MLRKVLDDLKKNIWSHWYPHVFGSSVLSLKLTNEEYLLCMYVHLNVGKTDIFCSIFLR
jgi:hypothetical protein